MSVEEATNETHPPTPPPSSAASKAAPLGSSVIPIVNKLQDIFAQLGSQSSIELPQVAVVGSQSSGKSSVLEALVGRDFLPRGNDICTRRPLVLQLLQTKSKASGGSDDEWGEFLHLPNNRIYDFSEIRREIEAETNRLVGENKGVSDKQIRLKIFSPNVLDITLVDLPGITKVPVGDQPTDIEARHRTIGVITKILVQHIKVLLPDLKSRISNALVATAKEHQSYGEITESTAGQGAILLNFLSKYCEAYSSLLEGKSEEMSTSELSGGARIHYIFQSIFVKSLEEVDPCEDFTDDDIRTAIQNATGPRSALFVPDVPFEFLVRRQISRLLDPSLQCARFIFDELVKRFPVLRKRMDEVIGDFLREGLEPSEAMIGDIIDMEMDYINTSHPNFIGGTKAVEAAMQNVKSSRVPHPVARPKDPVEPERTSSSASQVKSRSFLGRQANGIVPDQGVVSADAEKAAPAANANDSRWGIPSIFRGGENRAVTKENFLNKPFNDAVEDMSQNLSMIYLKEPPAVLRPSETHSEQEDIEIQITKLLLKSYYDIVRKNIEDSVPKAIMHFLVNHTKRELHNVFIKKLYRENLFEEMLQEPDEIAVKRKRTRETLHILQQAYRTLDELPMEAESVCSSGTDATGVSKHLDLPASSSMYSTSSSSYSASPSTGRRSRRAGDQHQNGYGF
ncbi:hypothetical protein F2Q69_00032928 [Brassica cretica]|uniref:Dynamin-type G domain-containing protein n=3 Tax=Brassica cretica TaxID=69181 RepID=A0A8S9SH27_BRACR|nr:hypothetical protein F2Q69_00032928 [Brassica cretica]